MAIQSPIASATNKPGTIFKPHDVVIDINVSGRGTITLDGRPFDGVRSWKAEGEAGSATVVTLSFYANVSGNEQADVVE